MTWSTDDRDHGTPRVHEVLRGLNEVEVTLFAWPKADRVLSSVEKGNVRAAVGKAVDEIMDGKKSAPADDVAKIIRSAIGASLECVEIKVTIAWSPTDDLNSDAAK